MGISIFSFTTLSGYKILFMCKTTGVLEVYKGALGLYENLAKTLKIVQRPLGCM